MTDDSIYDIGNADRYLAQEQPKGSPVAKGSTRATVNRAAPLARHASAFRFELAGTFSLFLPGSGQLLLGRIAPGFFFIASLGFLGALSWAVISHMDRLAPTLVLLGLPRASGVWSLGVIYGLATGLYLWNVLCSGNPTLRSSSAARACCSASILRISSRSRCASRSRCSEWTRSSSRVFSSSSENRAELSSLDIGVPVPAHQAAKGLASKGRVR